jgi:hypothetical protein
MSMGFIISELIQNGIGHNNAWQPKNQWFIRKIVHVIEFRSQRYENILISYHPSRL